MAVGRPWAGLATAVLCGSTAGAFCLYGVIDITGLAPLVSRDLTLEARLGFDAGIIVIGIASAGFAFRPIRRTVAAFLPIDPDHPVHAYALTLALIGFGFSAVQTLFTDVLASMQGQPSVTVPDIVSNEIPLLVFGVAGVGLFIRRDAGQTAARLGLVRPAWWHIALAFAGVGVLVAVAIALSWLGQDLTPGVAQRVDVTTQHLYGRLGGPGIIALALLPGICEEVLFRGALQPRLGLAVTALLFTSIHTQYALSFQTLAVFVSAIGLGLIRKYTNTTASATCHAGYNLLAGIGLGGLLLYGAMLVELGLIAAAAYGLWTSRRRTAAAGTP
ncbi:MAG: CPBP family intramembrane metalloprotease [Chloroflexi bacterium]|nr:MAG: CPBP family intramembrane metalloprotease [Chloroflexota bacterium]